MVTISNNRMLLVGIGASAAAGAALVLPMLLYYHFVDRRQNNTAAALTFCCTLTFALLLALLVPIDIMQASTAGSGSIQAVEEPSGLLAPSITEAAAAAHAANASSAFTPAGAAAAAAAAAGWAALRSATLPLTAELLQRMYYFLGVGVFCCCFLLTPAAIFYANETNKRRVGNAGEAAAPGTERTTYKSALQCRYLYIYVNTNNCIPAIVFIHFFGFSRYLFVQSLSEAPHSLACYMGSG